MLFDLLHGLEQLKLRRGLPISGFLCDPARGILLSQGIIIRQRVTFHGHLSV